MVIYNEMKQIFYKKKCYSSTNFVRLLCFLKDFGFIKSFGSLWKKS